MPVKRSQGGAEYIPLMTEDSTLDSGSDGQRSPDNDNGGKEDLDVASVQNNARLRRSTASRIVVLAIFTALALSLLSFAFSSLTFLATLRGNVNKLDTRTLERPSLYLGLERVPVIKKRLEQKPIAPPGKAPDWLHGHGHHNPPTIDDPNVIKPSAMRRISSLFPAMSFDDEKWITLTEWDSMLVEFQLPYDLPQSFDRQKCKVTAKVPPQSVKALMDRQVTIEPRGRTSIHVWETAPLPPAEHANITYNFKPARMSPLGMMEVGFDHQSNVGTVDCRAGGTVTLELACPPTSGTVGCRVEFVNTYSDLGIALSPLRL